MLSYFLIIFVVALALAPLGHFLPSKRQREVARMREYAAVHGLFVEYRDVPARAGGSVSLAAPKREVIYYGKRLPHRRGSPVESGAWVSAQEGWYSVGRRLPVPPQLRELPANIVAASVDQSSCGVYWMESAGEEAVEHIKQILERWSEAVSR